VSANGIPQREIVHIRDNSLVGSLPGQNRPFRRGKTRIAAKVVRGRHGNARKNDTLFRCSSVGIRPANSGKFALPEKSIQMDGFRVYQAPSDLCCAIARIGSLGVTCNSCG
jgi:hypothetical protein